MVKFTIANACGALLLLLLAPNALGESKEKNKHSTTATTKHSADISLKFGFVEGTALSCPTGEEVNGVKEQTELYFIDTLRKTVSGFEYLEAKGKLKFLTENLTMNQVLAFMFFLTPPNAFIIVMGYSFHNSSHLPVHIALKIMAEFSSPEEEDPFFSTLLDNYNGATYIQEYVWAIPQGTMFFNTETVVFESMKVPITVSPSTAVPTDDETLPCVADLRSFRETGDSTVVEKTCLDAMAQECATGDHDILFHGSVNCTFAAVAVSEYWHGCDRGNKTEREPLDDLAGFSSEDFSSEQLYSFTNISTFSYRAIIWGLLKDCDGYVYLLGNRVDPGYGLSRDSGKYRVLSYKNHEEFTESNGGPIIGSVNVMGMGSSGTTDGCQCDDGWHSDCPSGEMFSESVEGQCLFLDTVVPSVSLVQDTPATVTPTMITPPAKATIEIPPSAAVVVRGILETTFAGDAYVPPEELTDDEQINAFFTRMIQEQYSSFDYFEVESKLFGGGFTNASVGKLNTPFSHDFLCFHLN